MSRNVLARSSLGYQGLSTRNNLISNDGFPLLDFKELSACLLDCEFEASEELVSRPTASYVMKLFEDILYTFTGFSSDYCKLLAKQIRETNIANDPQGNVVSEPGNEEVDDTDLESTKFLVFFRAVNSFLKTCAVYDFSIMDLKRPDVLRTQRALSAVINFVRFREEHMPDIEHFGKNLEELEQRKQELDNEIVDVENRSDKLSERLRNERVPGMSPGTDFVDSQRSPLSVLQTYNSKLEHELIKLQRSQEVFKRDHASYKETKTRLVEKLEDQHFLLNESDREIKKMEAYASADPSIVRQVVADLKLHVQNAEEQVRDLELALRNKTRTLESTQIVEDELRNVIKIVQEINNDLRQLEDTKENYTRQIDDHNNLYQSSADHQTNIERARKQISKGEEKVVKLTEQAKEREKAALERSISLEQRYEVLTAERDIKQEKYDRTSNENSEIESQLQKLKLDYDTEVRNTESAIAKLTAHVRKYLVDIGKHI